MKRAPAATAAAAVGLVGVLAMHSGGKPPILSAPSQTTAPGKSATSTTSPPVASTAPPTGAARTAVGNNQQYGYGTLAVRVTVRAGRIANVSMANLQTAEQYSQSLAQQVIPILRNEVLSAQSAHINGISGATYTSEAYAQSVQSALDLLGAK
jgi:uncharacterized protein with FMN-binding domain